MARTTRAERKRRRESALQKVADGQGFSEAVTSMCTETGVSRATARRDVAWAHNQLALGLDSADLQHLIAHMCTSLQRVALKAERDRQYGASVGAIRLIYDILVSRRLDLDAKQAERRVGRHGHSRF